MCVCVIGLQLYQFLTTNQLPILFNLLKCIPVKVRLADLLRVPVSAGDLCHKPVPCCWCLQSVNQENICSLNTVIMVCIQARRHGSFDTLLAVRLPDLVL